MLAALSGFAAFAVQVLFVQAFAQVLNGSVYAFGAVLVVVLLTLALGAAVVAALERRTRLSPRTLLAFALALAGLALAGFPRLLFMATDGLRYVGAGHASGYPAPRARLRGLGGGPGADLPLAPLPADLRPRRAEPRGRLANESTPDGVGSALGRLVAVNTAGAIAGAIAAPYLLLPSFGLWPSFAAVGFVLAVASLAVRPTSRDAGLVRDLLLGLGWVAILRGASPLDVPPVRLETGEQLLFRDESAAGIVAVVERGGNRLIRTDNYSVLGGTSETVHQRRQGQLPLLLHPAAKRVAYVGSATGISAGAVLAHPVDTLRLVEIVPGVAAAARGYFRAENHAVYEDPRTQVALDDARNFLRATDERYDVVIADLFVPWRAGTGALYTREHFEAVRDHLTADGLFCQWLPLYQLTEPVLRVILATFLDVFRKAALFRGDLRRVSDRGPRRTERSRRHAGDRLRGGFGAAASGEKDRWIADPDGVWSLYVAPLAAFAEALATTPRNRDEHPEIEFLSARSHVGGARGKQSPVVGLAFARLSSRLAEAATARGDDVLPDAPGREPPRAAAGGAALQAAGAFYVEGRGADASRAFERAASLLPPRLVRDAEADPTAAEGSGGDENR